MPTLGEFIERAKRFGVKRKHTPRRFDSEAFDLAAVNRKLRLLR
jgi:hypothetical protein